MSYERIDSTVECVQNCMCDDNIGFVLLYCVGECTSTHFDKVLCNRICASACINAVVVQNM